MSDPIDHPPHYTFGRLEVIDVIEDWDLGFALGNAVKYIARAGRKGDALEDLRKAAWYLQRAIARQGVGVLPAPKPPQRALPPAPMPTPAKPKLAARAKPTMPAAPARTKPAAAKPVTEKFCGKCQRTKPVSEFSTNRAHPDGLQSQCKECQRAYWHGKPRIERADASTKPKPTTKEVAPSAPPVPPAPSPRIKPPATPAAPTARKELLRQRMDKRKGNGYLRCKVADGGVPCGSLQFAKNAAAHLAEQHDIELGGALTIDRYFEPVAPTHDDDR